MTVNVTKPALNIREKLAELDKPSGIAGEAMLRAGSVQEQRNLLHVGRKNLVINGGMDVWQRGTSFTSIGNGAYGADRFNTSRSHQVNISRVASGIQGFKYAHRHTNVTAGVGTLYHNIENTGQFYAGQSVTLSFWVRASEAIDVRTLRVWDGGAYVTSYDVVNLTTSWQKITTTQVINSNWSGSETTFGVQVWTGNSANMSAGSWIETTGVQLELGSVATDFEHRSYGEELALCQRYYHRHHAPAAGSGVLAGVCYATNYFYGAYMFPVEMRAAPTASISAISDYRILIGGVARTTTGFEAVTSISGARLGFQVSTNNLVLGQGAIVDANNNTATKYIAFDAEL